MRLMHARGCTEFRGRNLLTLVCACLVQFLVSSIWSTYAVYYDELFSTMGNTNSALEFVWVSQGFIWGVTGFMSSGLVKAYDNRKLCFVWAIFSCCGYVIMAFSRSFITLVIGFGVFLGTGAGIAQLTAIVTVQQTFKERRALATSICSSGISLAVFTSPPLVRLLINQYGWRGSCLIWGGIELHLAPVLFLLPQIFGEKGESYAKNEEEGDELSVFIPATNGTSADSCPVDISDPQRKDGSGFNETTGNPTSSTVPGKERGTAKSSSKRVLIDRCKKIIDISSLSNSHFTFTLISNFMFLFGINANNIYVVSRAIHDGNVDKTSAAFIASSSGIGSFVSKVVVAVVGDHFNKKLIYTVAAFASGSLTVVSITVRGFTPLTGFALSCGIFSGIAATLTIAVATDLVGAEKMAGAGGLLMLNVAIADISSAPLMGLLVSKTKCYNSAFVVGGVMLVLSSVLMLGLYVTEIYTRWRAKDPPAQNLEPQSTKPAAT